MKGTKNMKKFYKSKRLWAGIIAVLTGVGALCTGDQTLKEAIPELTLTIIGVVQTIIGLASGDQVMFGSKSLFKK